MPVENKGPVPDGIPKRDLSDSIQKLHELEKRIEADIQVWQQGLNAVCFSEFYTHEIHREDLKVLAKRLTKMRINSYFWLRKASETRMQLANIRDHQGFILKRFIGEE